MVIDQYAARSSFFGANPADVHDGPIKSTLVLRAEKIWDARW